MMERDKQIWGKPRMGLSGRMVRKAEGRKEREEELKRDHHWDSDNAICRQAGATAGGLCT
jgi:hypothetical protein